MSTIRINTTGINQIRQFLADNHNLGGDYFDDSMLAAWAADVERNYSEQGEAVFEIRSTYSVTGNPVICRISSDGYDIITRTDSIIEANDSILREFFTGLASCEYYDGRSWQLYLDLDDDSLMIHLEASDQSWLQRDDGSLVQILRVSGYCDTPADERYSEDGCTSLEDFGYSEWLDKIETRIAEAVGE